MSEVVSSDDCGIRTVNLTASHSDTMRVTANIFIGYLHFGSHALVV